MDMTCGQAAERWGLSPRRVQMYCKEGRIPGARKAGGVWLLPAQAQKPPDPRRAGSSHPPAYWAPLMLLDSAMTGQERGTWTAAQRRQLAAERAYMEGNYQSSLDALEGVQQDEPGYLAALTLRAAAQVSSGDISGFPQAWRQLAQLQHRHADQPGTLSLVELAQGLLAISAYATEQCPPWLLAGDLGALPAEARPLAMYVRAKALHGLNRMDALQGLADGALNLLQGDGVIRAYLHLMRAHAALYSHRTGEAEEDVHRAIDICLPQSLVSPLAETIHSLLGLLERCLLARSPSMGQQALSLHKRLALSWLKVHNYLAHRQLTLLLTRREYQVALAACGDGSIRRCAEQLGMSYGTFKGHLEVIYQKLSINSRRSLKEHISNT